MPEARIRPLPAPPRPHAAHALRGPRAGGALRALVALVALAALGGGIWLALTARAPSGTPAPEGSGTPAEPAPDAARPGNVTPAPAPARPPVESRPIELAAPGARPEGPRSLLNGVVVDDATGRPLERFVLRVLPSSAGVSEQAWEEAEPTTIVGEQGRWALRLLPDGVYSLRFEAEGFAVAQFEDVENPSPYESLEIRMNHGRWIHGRVLEASGAPARGLGVRAVPERGYGAGPPLEALETRTDAQGTYGFTGLPEARWKVEVAGLEGVLKEVPTSPVWFPIRDEEIVHDFTLPPLKSVEVSVEVDSKRFVSGNLEASLQSSWGGTVRAPVQEGVARFDFVDEGIYTLAIGKPQGDPWFTDVVTVPADQEVLVLSRTVSPPPRPTQELRLPRKRSERGRQGG